MTYSAPFSVDLRGKVALVTGGAADVGRAISLALAASGAAVAIGDINPDRSDALAEQIVAQGGQAFAFHGDVSNKYQAAAMIEAVRDRFNHLHILVNAAGTLRAAPFVKIDEYDWRRIVEINLTGTFFMTQLVSRVMIDEGGGVIVNLASAYGHPLPLANHASYVASKAGVIGLTREAARELAPHGVRVNAVCPAEIAFPNAPLPETPNNPQGRFGTPEEVAAVVLFLCSDAARFITGQALHVDGGLVMP